MYLYHVCSTTYNNRRINKTPIVKSVTRGQLLGLVTKTCHFQIIQIHCTLVYLPPSLENTQCNALLSVLKIIVENRKCLDSELLCCCSRQSPISPGPEKLARTASLLTATLTSDVNLCLLLSNVHEMDVCYVLAQFHNISYLEVVRL